MIIKCSECGRIGKWHPGILRPNPPDPWHCSDECADGAEVRDALAMVEWSATFQAIPPGNGLDDITLTFKLPPNVSMATKFQPAETAARSLLRSTYPQTWHAYTLTGVCT